MSPALSQADEGVRAGTMMHHESETVVDKPFAVALRDKTTGPILVAGYS